MLKYFIQRILAFLPKLLVITIIIFIGLELVPGDPLDYMLSPDLLSEMDPAQLEALRESMGLTGNFAIRYIRWMGGLLQGDFGYSLVSGTSIRTMIGNRLPATLELTICALILSSIVGLILGFISAIRQNSIIDYSNTIFGMLGISIPGFFLGLSLIAVFSLNLGWLPPGGRTAAGMERLIDRLEYLVLPVICLTFNLIATLMRYTRASMLDVLNKDFIKVARSKGIADLDVYINHGLRNALIPVMIVLVNRIPILVSGSVVIENVFNFPGMGSMMLNAINGADMPVVMIATLVIAVMILFSSLLVDIFTALLDPRIRFGEG